MSSQDWRLQVRHFVLPREDSTLEECEDAAGIGRRGWSYAVADGATEAFDARRWARRLAESWAGIEPSPPLSVADFGVWAVTEGEGLHAAWENLTLPWYAEEKRRGGSFAAFVGLHFAAEGRRLSWRAIAVGDSCLIQRRNCELRAALPLAEHQDFNSHPVLVPSRAELMKSALGRAVTGAGEAESGDIFLLLSDAIAAWFFELAAARHPLIAKFDSLLAASDNVALADLLRRERQAKKLKDDDVAIIRIAVACEPSKKMMNAK